MLKKLIIFLLMAGCFLNAAINITKVEFDGTAPANGETVADAPLIAITVTSSAAINFNSFVLVIDGVTVTTTNPYANYSYAVYPDGITTVFEYQVTDALSIGAHTIGISMANIVPETAVSNNTVWVKSNKFKMAGDLIIYPSPATNNAYITYELTKSEDVEIYMYSMNGEMVYQQAFSARTNGARAGFNSVPFDLKSTYGNKLPNGVYAVFVVQKSAGKRELLGKRKFFILREND